MLDALTDTFCNTGMCFGASKDAIADTTPHQQPPQQQPTEQQHQHQPITSNQAMDKEDGASSYSVNEQVLWHPVYAPSKVPSVIRMDSLVAPSTPIRGSSSDEREQPNAPIKHMLPSSMERFAELTRTPPSHFRQTRWEETIARSPSLLLKKANPVKFKYYEETTDEETVATKSTQSSYSLSLSSPAEGSGDELRLEWRKSGSSLQPRRTTTSLSWNDAVVEETDEGFRIHGPPELLRDPVALENEAYETPDRTGRTRRFQLRPRTTKPPSHLYLPGLD